MTYFVSSGHELLSYEFSNLSKFQMCNLMVGFSNGDIYLTFFLVVCEAHEHYGNVYTFDLSEQCFCLQCNSFAW